MRKPRVAMVKLLLTLPILPLLGGCMPPAVAVASYAADGASYVATGKSVSDHGISLADGGDCATWHFFVGRAVCEDPEHPVPTASLDEHHRDGSIKHAAAFQRQPKGRFAGGFYLAIGSFADRGNAERFAARYAGYRPRIVDATVDGKSLARVVLGPLDAAQRAALRAQGIDGFAVDAPRQAAAAGPQPARAG